MPVPPTIADLDEYGALACLRALREEFTAVTGCLWDGGQEWAARLGEEMTVAVAVEPGPAGPVRGLAAEEGDLLLARRAAPSLLYVPRLAYDGGRGLAYGGRAGPAAPETSLPYRVVETGGQKAARILCEACSVTPDTPRFRRDPVTGREEDVVAVMLRAVGNAVYCHSPGQDASLDALWGASRSWEDQIDNFGAPPHQHCYFSFFKSPWQVAGLLGDMADAGVTNIGHGQQWFRARSRADLVECNRAEREEARRFRPASAGMRPSASRRANVPGRARVLRL